MDLLHQVYVDKKGEIFVILFSIIKIFLSLYFHNGHFEETDMQIEACILFPNLTGLYIWNLSYGDLSIVTGNLILWVVLSLIDKKQKTLY